MCLGDGVGLILATILDDEDFRLIRLLLQKTVNLCQARWQTRFFIMRWDDDAEERYTQRNSLRHDKAYYFAGTTSPMIREIQRLCRLGLYS